MESTYGNRLHATMGNAKELLRELVREIAASGGKLLIPAFAVGRTQEVVYHLNQLRHEDAIPEIEVFVDSPLAVNATEVFRLHPECYDEQYLTAMAAEKDGDPLEFERLAYIRDVEDSKRLNDYEKPAVIIAASGMCEGGRILHHLRNHATRKNAIVLFVSFQAEHTLGRKISEGRNPVPIYGEQCRIAAQIRTAEGYSAHADRNGLLAWAERVQATGDVKRMFLVHGEVESAEALAEGLVAQGAADVRVPERGEEVEL